MTYTFQPKYGPRGGRGGILVHAVDVTESVVSRQKLVDSMVELYGLNQQLQRRLFEATVLHEFDHAILSQPNALTSLDALLERLLVALEADAAAILLLDPQHGELRFSRGAGFCSKLIRRSRLGLGQGVAGQVARDQAVRVVADVACSPE